MGEFQNTLYGLCSINRSLDEIFKVKRVAFRVFYESIHLDAMDDILHDSWKKLYEWNDSHNHFGHLYIQEWDDIESAFSKVKTASINRTEFKEALKESRDGVEKYIEGLKKALDEYSSIILDSYDNFFDKNAGDLNFIFKDDKVKDLIMKFIQSETC